MYSQNYDDYIRSILGYPANNSFQMGQYGGDCYSDSRIMNTSFSQNNAQELEECYPEIYKVVYPMVRKACQNINTPVTKEMVDRMTDELYVMVEGNDEVYLNINLNNNVENVNTVNTVTQNNRNTSTKDVKSENRETRQINRGLRDIIRILLLRELLGRPGFPGFSGNRPPFPPPSPRPPFPGGPGRPPIRPRGDYEFYDNLYEY